MLRDHARAGMVMLLVPPCCPFRFKGYEPQAACWRLPEQLLLHTGGLEVCVITFVMTGTLVSMTVRISRDGLSRVSDMAGEQSIQCVVVTIGGHTVLYAYSFLPSPFGYKPSFSCLPNPGHHPWLVTLEVLKL